jgi:hypothetical protein
MNNYSIFVSLFSILVLAQLANAKDEKKDKKAKTTESEILHATSRALIAPFINSTATRSTTTSCTGEFKPSKIVLAGAIIDSGDSFTESKDKVLKKIEEIKTYISGKNGEMTIKDTLRVMLPSNNGNTRAHSGANSVASFFEAKFSLDKEDALDEILSELQKKDIQLGIKSTNLNALMYPDSLPKYPVRYLLGDLEKSFDEILEKCKETAARDHCKGELGNKAENQKITACEKDFISLATPSYYSFTSNQYSTENMGTSIISIYYPNRVSVQEHLKESLSSAPILLTGSVTYNK